MPQEVYLLETSECLAEGVCGAEGLVEERRVAVLLSLEVGEVLDETLVDVVQLEVLGVEVVDDRAGLAELQFGLFEFVVLAVDDQL